MKTAHWTAFNTSGMNRVAETMAEAERRLGIDAHLCNIHTDAEWEHVFDADVHICHTHLPTKYKGKALRRWLTKPQKIVWVSHGTPENVFQNSVEMGSQGKYGHGDGWMLLEYWLRNSDARVTFWPRHKAIFDTMVDRGTTVHCVPLGVNHEYWSSGVSAGKWAGDPCVWSGENSHYIKWPLDLILMWPWVWRELDDAILHCVMVPHDQHRWFAPLIDANGSGFAMHWSAIRFDQSLLRNIFKSIDFQIGLVRYGDFNRLGLEANVAGATTISYAGNPYSDFWLPEGDQRTTANELVRILKGDVEPRAKEPVPTDDAMAQAMIGVYESIL